MEELEFHKTKYGKELLIDCLKASETKGFILNRKPFIITYYEIFFIINGKGVFLFNDMRIPYQKGTVMFLPPNRRREWIAENETDAYVILFEGEFFERFFNDSLFVYRFHYFHNYNTPFHLSTKPKQFNKKLKSFGKSASDLIKTRILIEAKKEL